MDLADAAGLWAVNFIQVLLLCFQSRNVNSGQHAMAMLTSVMIAGAQILLVKSQAVLPFWTLFAIIGTSGPLGILAGMRLFVHINRSRMVSKP